MLFTQTGSGRQTAAAGEVVSYEKCYVIDKMRRGFYKQD
jgi:hypothetical protein